MQLKKVDDKGLYSVVSDLKKEKESALGSFLYKGYRLQVAKYKQTTNERVSQLYHRRRAQGLCILCGKKVTRKNPKTEALYRLCESHRKKIDRK